MLLFARNPKRLALSKLLLSMCLWIIFKISFSKGLPVVTSRLIGHRFGGI
jgi:uncharacterized membrane protein